MFPQKNYPFFNMDLAIVYFWTFIFVVVLYMMAVDKNVAEFVPLFFLGVWVQLKKYYYMVLLHPFWIMNPIGRWWMMRKYRKLAESILKEQSK